MAFQAAVLLVVAVAERDGDVQVLMQRPPSRAMAAPVAEPVIDERVWLLRWAAGIALALLVAFTLAVRSSKESHAESQKASPDETAFREDLADLTTSWERSSSLPVALVRFCYCRHISSNLFGLALALLALSFNSAFAALTSRPPWSDLSHHVVMAALALVMATVLESTMRARYAREANRTVAVLLGLCAAKLRRTQASTLARPVEADQLWRCQEELREALTGIFQAAVVPLQVLPVFLWLWSQCGPWALLLGLALPLIAVGGSPAMGTLGAKAFLAYDTASRQRWDLLAAKTSHPQAQQAQGLREEALCALQVVHFQSHSWAWCISRCPQMLALGVLFFSSQHQSPEVLLVVFLQCQYVLRHLSKLRVATSPKLRSCLQRFEDLLRQDEVAPVEEVDGEVTLDLKGSFAWKDADDPSPLPCLSNLDLQVRSGEIVAILGTAGAGKTSLLRAACGCLTPLEGAQLRRSPSTVLVPSEPWICDASLQQNVLCGRDLEAARYQQVIKVCGLEEVTDLHDASPLMQTRMALARAAYGTETLVLLDDPFSGFSNEEVEELFEILRALVGGGSRSCVVSFGSSAPQRCLRVPELPGLRLVVMEAGTMQVVQEIPEFLNNEAFCCRAPSAVTATSKSAANTFGSDESAIPALPRSTRTWSWLLILCLDQLLQIGIDWWILSIALVPLAFTWQLLPLLVLQLCLKLMLARLQGALSADVAAATAADERQMDLEMPGQLWGFLAGSCTFFGLLSLSLVMSQSMAWQLSASIPIYLVALKALQGAWPTWPKRLAVGPTPLETSLRCSVELGAALKDPQFDVHQEQLLISWSKRPSTTRCRDALLRRLGLCVAAAYCVAAIMATADSRQAILTLAPFGMLLHFLIPWTESLQEPLQESA